MARFGARTLHYEENMGAGCYYSTWDDNSIQAVWILPDDEENGFEHCEWIRLKEFVEEELPSSMFKFSIESTYYGDGAVVTMKPSKWILESYGVKCYGLATAMAEKVYRSRLRKLAKYRMRTSNGPWLSVEYKAA
jgi:hypothetical protein